MVKQNQGWERRAEITEIRRSETKLRKQKTADKRQQKSMAQELLSMIDRHAQRPLNIHVWTDCIPTDSIPLLDAVRFEQSDKRRARAESMHDYDDAAARGSNLLTGLRGTLISGKGRVRSNSVNDSNRPNLASVDEERPSQPMFLCKAHFFTGKCLDVKGKKGGCRYNHYFAPYKTLCDVLKARKTQTSERALQQSAENAAYAGTASGDAAMEMIHYMHIQVDSGDDDTFISDAITNQLTAHGVKPASVVYAVVNNKLIYDRNQGGLLINDIGLKTDNGGRLSRDDTTLPNETLLSFPGSILEYTLTFLPDSAVAVATQVCKAWHQEIGQSPNLWRLMLERRNWPLPSIKSQSLLAVPDVPSRDLFRVNAHLVFDCKNDLDVRPDCSPGGHLTAPPKTPPTPALYLCEAFEP
ncbi:hypothetical protein MPSEU_000600100 [Mayamaea pseudoterrestris]|nr:hypothetical protein MPSEU_000600100 [Mayamaea pseudoterrestris]